MNQESDDRGVGCFILLAVVVGFFLLVTVGAIVERVAEHERRLDALEARP